MKNFVTKNLVWRGMFMPNFGVSTTILNPVDIFCRCYKLNFGLLQGQVKSYHFYEIIEVKRQYFYFCIYFLEQLAGNDIGQPSWILVLIYYYLINGIGLDWNLNNSFWLQHIPNAAVNKINIRFLAHNALSDQRKLDLTVLLIA